jgi:hypothetical protein
MIDWLLDFNHLTALISLVMLYLVLKGLDRIQGTLDAIHEDYRKVNHVDAREEMELHQQI